MKATSLIAGLGLLGLVGCATPQSEPLADTPASSRIYDADGRRDLAAEARAAGKSSGGASVFMYSTTRTNRVPVHSYRR